MQDELDDMEIIEIENLLTRHEREMLRGIEAACREVEGGSRYDLFSVIAKIADLRIEKALRER